MYGNISMRITNIRLFLMIRNLSPVKILKDEFFITQYRFFSEAILQTVEVEILYLYVNQCFILASRPGKNRS